jgi:hypothetical protein
MEYCILEFFDALGLLGRALDASCEYTLRERAAIGRFTMPCVKESGDNCGKFYVRASV